MADTWIKIENTTLEKIEVARIATALGMDRYAVLGRLIRIWSYFDLLSRDGHIAGIDAAFIDGLVGFAGFCAQLVTVGWMRIDQAGVTLPNFDLHNGGGAKTRALAARRNETYRAKKGKRRKSDAPRDAQPSHSPSPDKRREEEKREDQNSQVGMPDGLDEVTALAQEFAFAGGEGTSVPAIQRARAVIKDILAAGISPNAIRNEINHPDRQRSEHPWRMRDRLIPKKGPKNGKRTDHGDFDPIRNDDPSAPRPGEDAG